MKLTKIKLINWHLFNDTSIEVRGNFLLTGENGCGKSTLTDAIYFVLSGGDDNCFNNAANADAKRTLKSYVRGKLGNEGEGKEYLRNNPDLICHIALQYEDKKSKNAMVLGTVIEIIDDGKPKIKFYIAQNYKVCDDDYINEGNIVNFSELKSIFKAKSVEFSDSKLNNTQKERRKTIARDILKLDNPEKYSELLRKAIAFKPINEVSTFVDDFLLKEDNIEIESLMEEIRSYREIKAQLDKEQEKVDVLATFVDKAEKYYENSKRIKFYGALRILLEIKEIEKSTKVQKKEFDRLTDSIAISKQNIKKLSKDKDSYIAQKRDLENREIYKVLKEKKERRIELRKELDRISKKVCEVERIISEENKIAKKLGLKYRFTGDISSENYLLLREHLRSYKEDLVEIKKENNAQIAKLDNEINTINQELSDKSKELELIVKGKNTYDERTTALITVLRKELFNKYQRDIEVRPLCEYLEINDERWTNAIEGYLNTQRFDLIIDPKYYDDALEIYEKVKQELKIHYSFFHRIEQTLSYSEFEEKYLTEDNIDTIAQEYEMYLTTDKPEKYPCPIRYDVAEREYKEGTHAYAHIHIGAETEIRIPMDKIIKPLEFVDFVIKHTYKQKWDKAYINNEKFRVLVKKIKNQTEKIKECYFSSDEKCQIYLT